MMIIQTLKFGNNVDDHADNGNDDGDNDKK